MSSQRRDLDDRDGAAETLELDVAHRGRVDTVLDGGEHLVGHEDLTAGGDGAHPCRQVHDRADRGVLGAPVEADLTARGVADGDSDAEFQIVTASPPFGRQLRGPVPHGDGELDGLPRGVVEQDRDR